MKISKLDLLNITRYTGGVCAMDLPEKISVILGHNAEGKTTILDAIALGLTGACDRTDKAGKGQENLVTTGEKQGAIKLTVSNNGAEPLEVTRYVPGELAIEGQHGGKQQLQANLCEYLGTDVGALSAALSTTAFIDAKPSDQKGLLFGLLGLSFERNDVCRRVAAEVPLVVEGIEGLSIQMLHAAPVNLFTGDASTFENLFKHFYQLRRDYKRDLKALGEIPQPKLVEEPPTAEIVELLESLRGKRSELETSAATSISYARARDKARAEIEDLKAKLPDSGDPEAAREELAEVKDKKTDAQMHYMRKRDKASGLRAAVEALGSEDKACPLSPQIKCAMTAKRRADTIADFNAEAEVLEREAAEADEEGRALLVRQSELQNLANKPSRADLEAALKQKQSELIELPDPFLNNTDSEIATLTDRISEGERVLGAANREEGARQEREKQQEKRAGLEQTVEVLEALVDVLSPSGLPGKILSQTIGPIEERANARLQELTGGRYSLQLVLDPDFAVIVDHDGITTDLKRLSSSERFRIGLVLMDAIIHLTGLRFMVIDNADVLDSENRELLMDFIMAIQDDYDQVLVMSTIGPAGAHKPDPPIPGMAIYLLENGQLREVE